LIFAPLEYTTMRRSNRPNKRFDQHPNYLPPGGMGPMMLSLVKEVKKLNETEQTAELKRPPRVPDVPVLRLKQKRICTFRETYISGNITGSVSNPVFGSLYFTISSFNDVASYQGVFDTYRIIQCEVQFLPKYVVSTNTMVPLLYTVIDYDDANAPTTIGQLLDYDTLQISDAGTLQSRVLNPRAAVATYSGTFTSYAQDKKQWMDIANTGIQYYGVKYGLETAAYAAIFYEILVSVTFQCKSQR